VLFNNNFEDWGLRNARRMAQLLGVAPDPDPQAAGTDDGAGTPPAGEHTRLAAGEQTALDLGSD
jgi:hypothetical protein